MNCDCIERVDKKLESLNLRLATSIVFSNGMNNADATLTIATGWLDQAKKKRGKRPTALLVTYCPFCGVKANQATNTLAASGTTQT